MRGATDTRSLPPVLLLAAVLAGLGAGPLGARAQEESEPMRLDVRSARQKADGSYEVPSPVRMTEDGQLEFSNGTRLSRKQAMERLISSGDARGPDGRPIDPDSVIVNDDGTLTTREGERISRPATGGAADLEVSRADAGPGGETQDEGAELQEDTGAPGRRPASAVGGIEIIAGGSGKEGVAKVGEIPVLR